MKVFEVRDSMDGYLIGAYQAKTEELAIQEAVLDERARGMEADPIDYVAHELFGPEAQAALQVM